MNQLLRPSLLKIHTQKKKLHMLNNNNNNNNKKKNSAILPPQEKRTHTAPQTEVPMATVEE